MNINMVRVLWHLKYGDLGIGRKDEISLSIFFVGK